MSFGDLIKLKFLIYMMVLLVALDEFSHFL
jgi:hypothetical protein